MNARFVSIPIALLILAGCATERDFQQQGQTPMTAQHIQQQLVGHSLVGVTGRGYEVTWFIRPDGVIKGINGKGTTANSRDSGTWEVTPDGDFCTRWPVWGQGTKGCMKFYIVGDVIRACRTDGNCAGRFTRVPGNPAQL
jgi:hypothetical protein